MRSKYYLILPFSELSRRRAMQEAGIIDTILNGYNPNVRPIGNVLYEGFHRPVVVTVDLFIRSLKRVDDMKMQYDLHMTFRQKWRDDRLAYTNEGPDTVTLKDHHKIWIPDTFFLNEEEARRHVLEQPNTLIRVKRDGSVLYSTRLSMTLYCRMLFSKFPFDNQTCSFSIESYAYSEDDIVYAWDKDTAVKHAEDYAASVLFDITNITLEGGSSKAKQLNYSFIKALFHMQRKFWFILRICFIHPRFSYYLYQFYIPTTMLVIVSWLAFFLHPSKTTARILIGFGTLALLIIASMLINRDVPKTSYAKAIDVWTGG
ncbi:unnamed protein product [Toxocara canis]|uniref:Neur_chan_LBD domain-containing protein n=1 Tax=Toxocara canis TaxID=6265 RepID=A0A183V3L6_TOXCA|nr:unnamed protein product [Toxocara canis]